LELHLLLWILLGVALLVSVVTDILFRQILDVVTLPTLGLALTLRGYKEGLGDVERGAISGLISAAGAAFLFVLLAWKGRFGWGDVKLMAAVGAVFGYPMVMAALIFISLAGALQAVVTILWQGETLALAQKVKERMAKALRRGPKAESQSLRHIPYGVAIALLLGNVVGEHSFSREPGSIVFRLIRRGVKERCARPTS
jgi:prepilin peptidase CpaA